LSLVLEQSLAEYQEKPAEATALLKVGQAAVPAELNPNELAAWTNVARVLFNLHEIITRP
jgi:hypothetical protein